jgi:UPF0716 protein FxsA
MLWKLVLLLTIVPVVELYLLVKLTQATDFAVTLLVILGTGVVGAVLTRMEGLRVLRRIQSEVEAGHLPRAGLLDGVLILVAGALLVTPGVLTDAVGFLFLLPPTRRLIRRGITRWLRHKMEQGRVRIYKEMGFGPLHEEPPPGSAPPDDEEEQ